jgi:hypothetical protein
VRDWTAEIPANVSRVRISYLVIARDEYGRRRSYRCDYSTEAQAQAEHLENTGHAQISLRREVTVTHLD